MTNSPRSFLSTAFSPFLQAGVVLAVILLVMVGGKILQVSELVEVEPRFPWLTAASFMLFFALFNSVFSLSASNLNHYWIRSIPSFGVLALLSGLLAWAFSSIPIFEAGSYWWIFSVVSFGYLVFLSLMGLARKIVDFAEREEWNAPKRRNRR